MLEFFAVVRRARKRTELMSQTLGQAVASLAPTILAATYCNPFLLVILSLLCGVTIVRCHLRLIALTQLQPVGNMPGLCVPGPG